MASSDGYMEVVTMTMMMTTEMVSPLMMDRQPPYVIVIS